MDERQRAAEEQGELLAETAEELYEDAPVGYVSSLPDGTIIKVNATFLKWSGYRPEDVVGRRRFQDLLAVGDRIFYETHYAPLLRMQRTVREIAVDIVRADGGRLPALVNSTLKVGDDDEPVVIRTTVFNATDRREYERELLRARERTERLQQITATLAAPLTPREIAAAAVEGLAEATAAQNVSFGVVDFDAGRVEVLASGRDTPESYPLDPDRATTIALRTREPLFYDDVVSDGAAAAVIPLVVDDETRGVICVEFASPRRFSDEDRRFMLAYASQCAQALERARQRSERERLLAAEQEARREAEARSRAALALAHVGDGVLLVDGDDRVQLLNPAAEILLGLRADAAVGRSLAEVLPEHAPVIAQLRVPPLGSDEQPQVIPIGRGGHEQWLAVTAVAANGGVVYTLRDVTAQQELEQLRSDVIAVVSHELRTPLAGVFGAAVTLRDRLAQLDDEQRATLLDMIVRQADRQARILDAILLTSNLDRNRVHVDVEEIDVGAVARRVTEDFAADAPVGVTFESEGEVRARADAARLEQVVVALLDNAAKYGGGGVRVAVARAGVVARITVADEGPGIPPSQHGAVFEKFSRLDPSQLAGVGGIGLGLYIARELVERMHGRVGLLPTVRGATFFVDLPLAAAEVD